MGLGPCLVMRNKNGFKIAFYVYWLWHIALLIVFIFKFVFHPFLILSLNILNPAYLAFAMIFTFMKEKSEDYNPNYLWACIISLIARIIGFLFNLWGALFEISSPYYSYFLELFCLMLGAIAVHETKRSRDSYFKY